MSEGDEEGGGRNTDIDTRLLWGWKAGGRNFVFPYERCPQAEIEGGDTHVRRQHEYMRTRFNPFKRPLPLFHRMSVRVSAAV